MSAPPSGPPPPDRDDADRNHPDRDHRDRDSAADARLHWLSGGRMGELVRAHPWERSPLGPPEGWPQSLRTAVSICLASRFPMLIWWGPDLIQIYNDGYRPVLGAKHPASLGQPGAECWAEIWDVIGPMVDQVLAGGDATWSEDLLLLMERYGFVEETYFTFSYSAIRGEGGGVDGVLVTCVETTSRVLGERRLRTLSALSDLGAASAAAAGRAALAALADNPADLPGCLLYLHSGPDHSGPDDATGTPPAAPDEPAVLLGATGLAEAALAHPAEGAEAALPRRFGFTGTDAADESGAAPGSPGSDAAGVLAPFVRRLGAVRPGSSLGPLPLTLPDGRFEALLLPLARPGSERASGYLVALLSPRLAFDGAYRSFLELVAGNLATAVANARAYEEERRRAEALAELDRAKTTFFSNVSHEFRTPLTLMLGPVDALLRSDLAPPVREQLELTQRAGLRLTKLVNTLLEFSRIEAGRARASYRPTDLASATTDLASTFRSLVERAGLTLEVRSEPLSEPVYVDRDMWEKVVLNLLSNAFKHTFEGGIEVRLEAVGHPEHGPRARLRVRDSGIGIAAEELPKLFERFRRVERARGRSQEGSGIGLALVRELVRLHGGEVAVESEVGVGSTFTVSLPFGFEHLPAAQVVTDEADASPDASPDAGVGARAFVEEARRWLPDGEADAPEPPPGVAGERPRVQLADDNADMRAYLKRLLAPYYAVEAYADGRALLERARVEPPDLILSDVMMPGLDGFELLAKLRAHPATRTLPVILLSARAGEEARVEGLDAGADDYLVKPFSAPELLATVRTHLKMNRLRRQTAEAERQARELLEEARDELEQRVQERTREVRALASRLALAEGAERQRIGRRLHDDLQQQLHALQMALARLRPGRSDAEDAWQQARELLAGAIHTTRQVTSDLNPPRLQEGELAAALRQLGEQMQQRYGLRVDLAEDGTFENWTAGPILFGLARELLFNVVKHAGVDRARVQLRQRDGEAELVVSDRGVGFDPALLARTTGTGLGLSGVRERLLLFGGSLEVASTPGEGTRVSVRMPLGEPAGASTGASLRAAGPDDAS